MMVLSLSRQQRAALLFVSASAFLAWFSGFGDRLDAQGFARDPRPSLTIVSHAPPPRVSTIVSRDPFAGAPALQGAPDVSIPSVANGNAAEMAGIAASDRNDTVPNIRNEQTLASVPNGATSKRRRIDSGRPRHDRGTPSRRLRRAWHDTRHRARRRSSRRSTDRFDRHSRNRIGRRHAARSFRQLRRDTTAAARARGQYGHDQGRRSPTSARTTARADRFANASA